MLLCGGCAWTVYPPAITPGEAVTAIYAADYGWHSSLLLPTGDGKFVEYVYGDWGYAAEGRTAPWDAMGALTASRQATLGRRFVELDRARPEIDNAGTKAKLVEITVPKSDVDRLLKEMDDRYKQGTDSKLNPENHQLYVKINDSYSWTNSCNTMTARNLRLMGCRVEGNPVLSNFNVVKPQSDRPQVVNGG